PLHIGCNHVGDLLGGAPSLEHFFAARAYARSPHFVARMLEEDLEPLRHRRLIIYCEHTFFTFEAHIPSSVVKTRNVSIHDVEMCSNSIPMSLAISHNIWRA